MIIEPPPHSHIAPKSSILPPPPQIISPSSTPPKLFYDTSDDDSVKFEYDESEDELEDMTLDGDFEKMDEEEKKEKNYISNYL